MNRKKKLLSICQIFVLVFLVGHENAFAQDDEPAEAAMQRVEVTAQRPRFEYGIEFQDIGSSQEAVSTGSENSRPNAPEPTTCRAETAHPVVITTGEKILAQQDFLHYSLQNLSLLRTYQGFEEGENYHSNLFGPKWITSFELPKLRPVDGESVVISTSPLVLVTQIYSLNFPGGRNLRYRFNRRENGVDIYQPVGFNTEVTPSSELRMSYGEDKFTVTVQKKDYLFGQSGFNYNGSAMHLKQVSQAGKVLYTYTYDEGKLTSIVTGGSGVAVLFRWNCQGKCANVGNERVVAVTAPDGGVWSYGYDSYVNLTSVTPPSATSGVVTYHYEDWKNPYELTGYSIDGARHTRYSYEPEWPSRVVKSGLASGEEFETFEYSDNATVVRNALGATTRYEYITAANSEGQRRPNRHVVSTSGAATSSCPTGTATRNAYIINEKSGRVLGLDYSVDRNGNTTKYARNVGGAYVLSKTTAAGTPVEKSEVYTWILFDQLQKTTYRDALLQPYLEQEYTYVQDGPAYRQLESTTLTDLRSGVKRIERYSYTFDVHGHLAKKTITRNLPAGTSSVELNYDINGFLTSGKNALGQVRSASNHDGLGRPKRMVDENGIESILEYDSRGNIVSKKEIFSSGTRTTVIGYDGKNRTTSILSPNGRSIGRVYNAANRLISSTINGRAAFTENFDIATRTYAEAATRDTATFDGTALLSKPATDMTSRMQVDSEGRPSIKSGNAGQIVKYVYDGNGNIKTATDAKNRVTEYTYDALNRVRTIKGADNAVVKYDYDASGNLQYVTDQRQLVTEYQYDSFGSRTKLISPDSGTTSYIYDLAGRITSETRQGGKVLQYTWDALDRMRTRTSNGVTQTYTYDENSYGIGRLTSFSDSSGSTRYQYSPAGRLLQQTNTIKGRVFNTNWVYDDVGLLTEMTYPTGLVLNYRYDSHGRLIDVKSPTR